MKYIDNQIFQFVGNHKPLSLDLNTSTEVIKRRLAPRKSFSSSAESIDIDDMSFDYDPRKDGHLFYYVRIFPGLTKASHLTVGDLAYEKISKARFNALNFVRFFVEEKIEFKFDHSFSFDDEQRCIVTEKGDRIFFHSEDGKNYYCWKSFCNSV